MDISGKERVGVAVIVVLAVAAAVVENAAVFSYFPMLLLAGTAAGTLIGLLGSLILARLPKNLFFIS